MLHIITRLILSIVNVPMDLLALIGQVDYLKSMHDTYLKRCMNIFGIIVQTGCQLMKTNILEDAITKIFSGVLNRLLLHSFCFGFRMLP